MPGVGVTRRDVLGAAAAGGIVLAGCGSQRQAAQAAARHKRAEPFDPRSWRSVRAQFELDPRWRDFAAFYLAAHSAPVRAAIARHREGLDEGTYEYVGRHEFDAIERVRKGAAAHLGVPGGQIALTDSTTMGLGLVYNGMKLAEGDEIVTTEHDFW